MPYTALSIAPSRNAIQAVDSSEACTSCQIAIQVMKFHTITLLLWMCSEASTRREITMQVMKSPIEVMKSPIQVSHEITYTGHEITYASHIITYTTHDITYTSHENTHTSQVTPARRSVSGCFQARR